MIRAFLSCIAATSDEITIIESLNLTTNRKNVYGVLGIRTWDRRMEDANEPTELW